MERQWSRKKIVGLETEMGTGIAIVVGIPHLVRDNKITIVLNLRGANRFLASLGMINRLVPLRNDN